MFLDFLFDSPFPLTLRTTLSEHNPVVQRIDLLDALARPQTEVPVPVLALERALRALVVAAGLRPAQVRTDLVGADELLVLVDDGPAEGALEDHDGRQH